MLTGIKRIKGLGVFGDFAAPSDLPPFARYNIIYGENGSGKTTLSRLFGVLEVGTHPEFAELEYALDSQSGALTQGQCYARKVRVFNADYVEGNIGQFQGPLRHILIIGEENKALAEEAVAEKALYDERTRAIAAAEAAAAKLEIDKGKVFSAIARTIGEATSGSTLRSYRKPDAEAAFAKVQEFATLNESALEAHRATVHQEQLDAIAVPEPRMPSLEVDMAPETLTEVVAALPARIAALLARTAQAGALRRLVEEPLIARWIEEGIAIHRQHGSDRCEFCDQPLPVDRMAQLAQHFGVEDQRLKNEIEVACRTVRALGDGLAALALPVRTALYSELRDDFDSAAEAVEGARTTLAWELDTALALLNEKLLQRASSYAREIAIDPAPLAAALARVAAIIARHNAKTNDFERAKRSAQSDRASLSLHHRRSGARLRAPDRRSETDRRPPHRWGRGSARAARLNRTQELI
jgi:wobble nucleotide-excising tRNase